MKFSLVLMSATLAMPVASIADTEYVKPAYTIELRGSPDIPDAVTFRLLLELLKHDHYNDDIDSAVYRIQKRLELAAEIEAAVFLGQLITLDRLAEAEEARVLKQHYCSEGDPYEIMQRSYEVSEGVLDQHLRALIDTLPLDIGERLDGWIDEMKLSTFYTRFDFREMDRRRGTDSTGSVKARCLGN